MPKLPSEKLRSLATLHKAKGFKQILEKDLYPFLDQLPASHQRSLLAILNNAGTPNEAVDLVEFDTRSQSITKGLKALVKSVNSDWKNGWGEQGEMMGQLLGELSEWMPILWKVGVEMGVEHTLVHKSLKFCKLGYDKLGNTNSRTEFSDMDDPDVIIQDTSGKVVYKADYSPLGHIILWVWRELLLSSMVHSRNDSAVKAFVADIKKLKLSTEMLKRLDHKESFAPELSSPESALEKVDFSHRDWELEEKRDLLLNAHWTPEIRAAVPKVKALLA